MGGALLNSASYAESDPLEPRRYGLLVSCLDMRLEVELRGSIEIELQQRPMSTSRAAVLERYAGSAGKLFCRKRESTAAGGALLVTGLGRSASLLNESH